MTRPLTIPFIPICAIFLSLTVLGGCNRTSSAGGSRLRLTEVMANNQRFPVADENGAIFHANWVEIHNPGTTDVSLAGFGLSDRMDDPDKHRFPPGASLRPGEYLVVFLLDREECLLDCDRKAVDCERDAQTFEERAECARDEGDCALQCRPAGNVADFNLNDAGETVFLFSADDRVVDRIGVRNQPADVSNGIDPETGEHGIMYVATPGGPNHRINRKPLRFVGPPRVLPAERPPTTLTLEFLLEADAPASAPAAAVDHAMVASCAPPEGGENPGRVLPVIVKEESAADIRQALEGPISIPVLRWTYRAVLPGGECGQRLAHVVTVDSIDDPKTGCTTLCDVRPTVIVSEYQPQNTKLFFERVRPDAIEAKTPDWLEIHNYGDEPAAIGNLGLIGGDNLKSGKFSTWLFGRDAGVETLAPGGYMLILADDDGGDRRRQYRRPEDPSGRIYSSTRFELRPTPGTDGEHDKFALVQPANPADRDSTLGGEVLDLVELDFSETSYVQDQSVARFPEIEGNEPDALDPGTVTSCPTPEAPNALTCELEPTFRDRVTIETRDSLRCPAPGEPVTVHASISFDQDSPAEELELELRYRADGGAEEGIRRPDLRLEPAPEAEQAAAAPGGILYTIRAVIPGQASGRLVVFRFLAADPDLRAVLISKGVPAEEARERSEEEHSETAPSGAAASFRYVVGFDRPAGSPLLNEVLPRNTKTPLPYFTLVPEADRRFRGYIELYNPSDSPADISGYHLTDSLDRARLFEIPPGAVLPARGFILAHFGPAPASLCPCTLPVSACREGTPPCPTAPFYIEVTGIEPDSARGTIHLVAPDEKERGANCAIDSLTWSLASEPPEEDEQDSAMGRVCDGGSRVLPLRRPSPEGPNLLPLILRDAFHKTFPTLERNPCVAEGASVQLSAVVFMDELLREIIRQEPTLFSVRFLADRGSGEEPLSSVDIIPLLPCTGVGTSDCATPPRGYSAVALRPRLPLSPPFPPVVRYRVIAGDGCGTTLEGGPFSFGTAAGEHPRIAINEIHRSYPVAAGEAPRPWVELYNAGASEIDLAGVFLSDDPVQPRKARLPEGVRIGAGGAVLVLTSGSPSPQGVLSSLDWTRERGTLHLFDSMERGTCSLDSFAFDFAKAPPGSSLGRDPDGTGPVTPLAPPSPARPNGAAPGTFVRGDANSDLKVNITDMIRSLAILFSGDPARPACEDALDANDDGLVNGTDPIYIGNFVFLMGPDIPDPFPAAGGDPTPDALLPCEPVR